MVSVKRGKVRGDLILRNMQPTIRTRVFFTSPEFSPGLVFKNWFISHPSQVNTNSIGSIIRSLNCRLSVHLLDRITWRLEISTESPGDWRSPLQKLEISSTESPGDRRSPLQRLEISSTKSPGDWRSHLLWALLFWYVDDEALEILDYCCLSAHHHFPKHRWALGKHGQHRVKLST